MSTSEGRAGREREEGAMEASCVRLAARARGGVSYSSGLCDAVLGGSPCGRVGARLLSSLANDETR